MCGVVWVGSEGKCPGHLAGVIGARWCLVVLG